MDAQVAQLKFVRSITSILHLAELMASRSDTYLVLSTTSVPKINKKF